MKNTFVLMLLPAFSISLKAHEHWLETNNMQPSPGDTIEITLNSGHYYPKSNLAIADKLIHSQVVYCGQESEHFSTQVKGKRREGTFTINEDGEHLFEIELQRPQLKEPSYICRLLLGNPDKMVRENHGLEIIPVKDPDSSAWRFYLFFNGQPVKGTCSMFLSEGRHVYYKSEPGKIRPMTIPPSSTVMITANHKGTGCSLVLYFKGDPHEH
jgi:hypothetical protein